jgi:hypothetical protein
VSALDTPIMEASNRFAVPANDLDSVRVYLSEHVQEQTEPRAAEFSEWGGQLPPVFGGGGGANADADGE